VGNENAGTKILLSVVVSAEFMSCNEVTELLNCYVKLT